MLFACARVCESPLTQMSVVGFFFSLPPLPCSNAKKLRRQTTNELSKEVKRLGRVAAASEKKDESSLRAAEEGFEPRVRD